ncbi:MAG: hypothetical protein R2769_04190 [Saprospiraceae bacterium]
MRDIVPENERAVDELLIDLQRKAGSRREIGIHQKEKRPGSPRLKSYEDMSRSLEFGRKENKAGDQGKSHAGSGSGIKGNSINSSRNREQQNLEKAKQLIVETKKDQKRTGEEVKDLREKVYFEPYKKRRKRKENQVEDFVKIRSSGTNGEVEIIEKKRRCKEVGDLPE